MNPTCDSATLMGVRSQFEKWEDCHDEQTLNYAHPQHAGPVDPVCRCALGRHGSSRGNGRGRGQGPPPITFNMLPSAAAAACLSKATAIVTVRSLGPVEELKI